MKKKTNEDLQKKIERLQKRIAELEAGSTGHSMIENQQTETNKNAELSTIKALLDSMDDVIYVADPETYELLLVNESLKKKWGGDVLGKKCYAILQDREEPCPFCTNDKIFGEYLGRSYVWEFQNEVTGNWYRCIDRAIDWVDGRKVRFELASNITSFKQTEQKLLEHQIFLEKKVEERTEMINEELQRRKNTEKTLRESEAAIQNKLRAITDPDADLGELGLSDIMDLDLLRPIMEDFNRLTGIANAVIDIEGNVLAGTGWQDICTQFHRCHPDTLNNCLESDIKLSKGIPEGTFKVYRCKNNLWDMATPIMLGGRHLGNLFIGQYLQKGEVPDENLFREQARQYGFEEYKYFEALARVPRIDPGQVDDIMAFFSKFAQMISSMGLKTIQLSRALSEQKRVENELRESEALQKQMLQRIDTAVLIIDAETHIIEHTNKKALDMLESTEDNLVGTSCYQYICSEQKNCCPVTDLGQTVDESERVLIASPKKQIPVIQSAKIITIKGKKKILETFIDISNIKRAEETLKRQSAITTAINRIFRETLTCDTEEAVAKSALRVAGELTGSKFGFIGEVNPDGRFDTIGLSDPGWESCTIDGSTATIFSMNMEIRGIWATVLRAGTTQIINDPSSHPEGVGIPEGHPALTSFMGVPFIRQNHAVGMIALANKEGGYKESDREAIESLAPPFYEALLRKRLELQVQAEAENKEALAELSGRMSGDQEIKALCTNIITYLCGRLQAPTGLMYITDETGAMTLNSAHAHRLREDRSYTYRPGEGLVGQAALSKKPFILEDVPESYLAIESGLGAMPPQVVYLKPILHNDRVIALLELGFLKKPNNVQANLLETVNESIAAAVLSARSREIQKQMLKESQEMTEELQRQQEELQTTNEEMEEQTQMLTASENRLKEQQEELQAANEELEEKTEYLEQNKKQIEEKNTALMQLGRNLEKKAEDLAIAGKYKSEFLANMSHELRTPLNSLLLLSRMLADNKKGNLLDDQVDSARIIYNSGNDLLALINEILDLSKIEAGKMQLSMADIPLTDLKGVLEMNFGELARENNLSLDISISDSAPDTIVTDQLRILQVLKNFIANAFKFTETGGITVKFYRPDDTTVHFLRSDLTPENTLGIDVTDTGIGIPEEKQKIIFDAFQQVEGGSSRKYGGTGLGLSISRELANLLGGEIMLTSRKNEGSTFTLYLPINGIPSTDSGSPSRPDKRDRKQLDTPAGKVQRISSPREFLENSPHDDRDHLHPDDRVILIIEDDADFAGTLLKFCREKGFKGIVAPSGEEGLKLADIFRINAIILDIHLPGMDGWAVLDTLKENPATRHIPVHFMSADDPVPEAFTKGAVGYLTKPVASVELESVMTGLESIISKGMKELLLVEDNDNQRHAVAKLISDSDVAIREVATGEDAIKALLEKPYDCMILDLGLPDMSGFDLLKKMEKENRVNLPPVVVYTGRELTKNEETELRRYSESIIIKGARSEERLLDETSLFLHRVVKKMPEEKRKIITALHDPDKALQDRTILIVDDDMRNVFALSRVLIAKGAVTLKAENGIKALEVLDERPDVDLVLMDIMMPVMDGYETMRKIRAENRFDRLPIIALTAKAMQRDKEECIAAGASDYLAKPVEIGRLLSMMRVWLYR